MLTEKRRQELRQLFKLAAAEPTDSVLVSGAEGLALLDALDAAEWARDAAREIASQNATRWQAAAKELAEAKERLLALRNAMGAAEWEAAVSVFSDWLEAHSTL